MTQDHGGTEPITRLEDVRADHNVVAAFAGLEEARAAIEALERAGVPADALALLGASRHPDPTAAAGLPDSGAAGQIGAQAAAGAGAGGLAAGAAGALTSFAIPGVGPVVAAGIWAIAGAGAGGVLGAVSATGGSPAWRHTFEAVSDGNVAVGVHSDDAAAVARGREVLEGLEPLAVNSF